MNSDNDSETDKLNEEQLEQINPAPENPVTSAEKLTTNSGPLDYPENILKLITPYKLISYEDFCVIEEVIQADEGGWVLSSVKNDNDGGFTYAGVTAKTFKEYLPNLTIDTIKNKANIPLLSQRVIEIYYSAYYKPITDMHKFFGGVPIECRAPVYSCIVNTGVGTAENLWNSVEKEYILFERRGKFLLAWTKYYVGLLERNSVDKEFILGWIDRVFNYV